MAKRINYVAVQAQLRNINNAIEDIKIQMAVPLIAGSCQSMYIQYMDKCTAELVPLYAEKNRLKSLLNTAK